MAYQTARQRVEVSLSERIEEFRAIQILARSYNRTERERLWQFEHNAESESRRQLESRLEFVTSEIKRVTKRLRPTQSSAFYVKFLAEAAIPPGTLLYLPKWQLQQLFAGYEAVNKGFKLLPEHTQLSMDIHGFTAAEWPGELRILEAALFEDMCVAFNLAWEFTLRAREANPSKSILKKCAAMRRSAVLCAFYFIEAYLNSIAFDFLVAHSGSTPSQELDKIAEWDHVKSREKLVNFREKLLQYPKIILGAAHPPLQESNCPAMKYILESAKQTRDAIVHASPRLEPFSVSIPKEIRFWVLGSASPIQFRTSSAVVSDNIAEPDLELTQTVDSAISLVRTIESTIHGHTDRLFWMQSRGRDGFFPESVFD